MVTIIAGQQSSHKPWQDEDVFPLASLHDKQPSIGSCDHTKGWGYQDHVITAQITCRCFLYMLIAGSGWSIAIYNLQQLMHNGWGSIQPHLSASRNFPSSASCLARAPYTLLSSSLLIQLTAICRILWAWLYP